MNRQIEAIKRKRSWSPSVKAVTLAQWTMKRDNFDLMLHMFTQACDRALAKIEKEEARA